MGPRAGDAGRAGRAVLDTWYPDAAARGAPGRRRRRRAGLAGGGRRPRRAPRRAHRAGADRDRLARRAARRRARRLPAPAPALAPADPARTRPNLTGIFGVLPNVAWTTPRPGRRRRRCPRVRMRFRAAGEPLAVTSVDKFPRMTDYVVPVGRADRRRRPRPARRAPRRGHDRDARGLRQLQRRHARRLDGRGPDLGRRRRRRRLRHRRRRVDHGHAVGRRHRGHLDRRALPARRQRRPRHLARRRLHRRGRASTSRRARA